MSPGGKGFLNQWPLPPAGMGIKQVMRVNGKKKWRVPSEWQIGRSFDPEPIWTFLGKKRHLCSGVWV
jgi:hypothetical protein